jgi:NitT/TauT family transport system ATP-binding protein
VRSVSKTYTTSKKGVVRAIDSVSFDVKAGEFVSIVGHSGCGKTTLLRIITGLTEPTTGSVTISGKAVALPMRGVGHVYQKPALMPWRSAIENVLLPIELLHGDKESARKKASALLASVGLKGFESLYPRELSVGMQHRVSLARALIHDPQILVMDEPFGSLDELTREEMATELLKITESLNKTVFFVTHSVSEAVMLGDRVLVLSPRPSKLVSDVAINVPRPRTEKVRTQSSFIAYCEEIRSRLGSNLEGQRPVQ